MKFKIVYITLLSFLFSLIIENPLAFANNQKIINLKNFKLFNEKILPKSKIEMVKAIDQHLIIAGIFTKKSKQHLFVAKLDNQLKLDSNFAKKGILHLKLSAQDKLFGLAVDDQKRIYLSGSTLHKKKEKSYLIRLSKEGEIDKKFGKDGFFYLDLGVRNEVHFLKINQHNEAFITGFYEENNLTHGFITKINSQGNLDLSFADQGIYKLKNSSLDRLFGLSMDQNYLYAAGATKIDSSEQIIVVSLNKKGDLNKNFGERGIKIIPLSPYQNIAAAIINHQNSIYLTGFSTQSLNNTDAFVAKMNLNGVMDLGFGKNGIKLFDLYQKIDNAHALSIHNENLWISGEFHSTLKRSYHPDGILLIKLSLYHSNLDEIYTITKNLKAPIGINSMDIDKNGTIWLGGFSEKHFTLAGINELK
jgi:uncharacterized delta-60 repeat protein